MCNECYGEYCQTDEGEDRLRSEDPFLNARMLSAGLQIGLYDLILKTKLLFLVAVLVTVLHQTDLKSSMV